MRIVIQFRMGLAESTLKAKTIRPIIRADTITPLPSFALDSCIFSDNSAGFLVTTVDLAKNMTSYSIPVKDLYSPAENTLVYIGKDESSLSFIKDRLTGRVFCKLCISSKGSTFIRVCLTTYDPIDNEVIDKVGTLFSKVSQSVSVAV